MFKMDFTIIRGKRDKSELYFIPDIQQVFKANYKKSSTIYLRCYVKQCPNTGKIMNGTFSQKKTDHSHTPEDVKKIISNNLFHNTNKDDAKNSHMKLEDIFEKNKTML